MNLCHAAARTGNKNAGKTLYTRTYVLYNHGTVESVLAAPDSQRWGVAQWGLAGTQSRLSLILVCRYE